MQYITENQIVSSFIEHVLPIVVKEYEQDNRIDEPARCEAFNNYVDSLHRNEDISEEMANNICIPDFLLKQKAVTTQAIAQELYKLRQKEK